MSRAAAHRVIADADAFGPKSDTYACPRRVPRIAIIAPHGDIQRGRSGLPGRTRTTSPVLRSRA